MDSQLVTDPSALATLVDDLRGADAIAMDTEFMWEKTFYPKLALIQVAANGVAAAVDPLAIEDLMPLWDLLAETPMIVHAGATDLEIMLRLGGRVPADVFDTQRAAAFLGYGDQVGYSKLVAQLLGSGPSRVEGYTDWMRRPLTESQVEYALDDVRPLAEVASLLQSRLAEVGRVRWVAEEQENALAALRDPALPSEQWRRVSGSRKLRGRSLAVLQDVAEWRELEARRRDVPRQHLVPDRVLIEVARRSPTTKSKVSGLRGFHPREAQRSAEALAGVVRSALERVEADWPSWPDPPAGAADPRVDVLASLFDAVIRDAATRLELAPRLLANRADLERLARSVVVGEELPDLDLLHGWRFEAAGADVEAVATGVATLRVDPSGPKLQLDR